ncbi:MAG: thioredoxin family protein [Alphaproteobacteria bacterium]|nr:thioredoxin family protein [Alphaproteobacteria bacterium]
MAISTPICNFGWPAPDFSLQGIDGQIWTPDRAKGLKGLVVMFLCNHCPYVQAIAQRLVKDVEKLHEIGVGAIGIMSNDTIRYPEDSFENMKGFAQAHAFGFPYVIDQSQETARAYDAVCTPDFFGFNADLALQYRGRLDSSGRNPAPPDAKRELYLAMKQVAETGQGPQDQVPSMGCSIKWREA